MLLSIPKHVAHKFLKISFGWTTTVLSNVFFAWLIHTVPKNPYDSSLFSWYARFKHRSATYAVLLFHPDRLSNKTVQGWVWYQVLFIFCQACCAYRSFARHSRNSLEIAGKITKNSWKRKHLSFVFRVWYHLHSLTRCFSQPVSSILSSNGPCTKTNSQR